jgi:hypothetical protein
MLETQNKRRAISFWLNAFYNALWQGLAASLTLLMNLLYFDTFDNKDNHYRYYYVASS